MRGSSQQNIPIVKRSPKTRGIKGSTDIWMKQMTQIDMALWGMPKPFWAIDNKMYDLTEFAKTHPGGSSWINYTKGQDITALFKTHHLQEQKTRKILQKYYVGECPIKNQSRFEFDKEGHYEQIKKRILSKFTVQQLQDTKLTQFRCTVILIFWLVLVALCGYFQSYMLAFIIGFFSMCHYGIGHLFIHKKDTNLLRHAFILIGFSAKQQQIFHAISHHPYSNTMIDYEYAALQPVMKFARCLPQNKWFSPILLQILFITVIPSNIITKLVVVPLINRQLPSFQHALTLLQIVYLYIFTGDWTIAFKLFGVMILSYGLFFGKMVLCPHRQDLLWSEGAPQIRDFVIHMIASTTDLCHTSTSYKSLILYSGFNIHILHHLFPTIDHSKLPQCNQIFVNYCKEKGIKINVSKSMFQCNRRMLNLQWRKVPFQIKNFMIQ